LTRVAKAVANLERAEARAEEARQELYVAIRESRAAGESVTLIASVAKLTRQHVHRILRGDQ
jgi:hypothetical protein